MWNNPSLWTVLLFLIPTAIGWPIAISMGFAMITVAWSFDMGIQMISLSFFNTIAKFPLLAIPLFILSGILMERSGIAERLVRFIRTCVGSMTGGMAIASVVVATLWGALSGSGPATVAALGVILIPAMVKEGYNKAFSASVVSCASGLAIIIPPSTGFVLYALLANSSVAAIFAAGILPGIVMALCLIVSVAITTRKHGWRGAEREESLLKSLVGAVWALMAPLIILGGIYGGIFTPTEAASVSVAYALFVGVFIYKRITWAVLYEALATSAAASAVVMLLVGCGGLYAWVATTTGMIDRVAGAVIAFSDNPTVVLSLLMICLLGLGMIMDGVSIYFVVTPLMMPIMRHFGWDSTWFGVLMTMNIAIGQVTPPVAGNLFVGARLADLTIEDLTPWVIPLVIASVVAMFVVMLFPEIALFLPRRWGLL